MKYLVTTLVLLPLLFAAGGVRASTVNYDCAETNGSFTTDCGIGESQLLSTLSDNGTSATFRFQNLGSSTSIISNIYFDDTALSLLDFSTVAVDDAKTGPLTTNIGVIFTDSSGAPVAATPGDLPGAVPFDVSFAIGRDKGSISRGINNASSEPMLTQQILDIKVDYSGVANFLLLSAALDSGAFQIGLKVQAFMSGGSEWFTSTTTKVVPVPAAFWLFGTALIGFIGYSRRRTV